MQLLVDWNEWICTWSFMEEVCIYSVWRLHFRRITYCSGPLKWPNYWWIVHLIMPNCSFLVQDPTLLASKLLSFQPTTKRCWALLSVSQGPKYSASMFTAWPPLKCHWVHPCTNIWRRKTWDWRTKLRAWASRKLTGRPLGKKLWKFLIWKQPEEHLPDWRT